MTAKPTNDDRADDDTSKARGGILPLHSTDAAKERQTQKEAPHPAPQPRRPRTVAIIQARMGSSRLPGKVMQKIAGLPMLSHVVTRARKANLLDQVVVATSTHATDNAIAGYCFWHDIACFRGDETDVLDRYHQAAQNTRAEVVVRLTADCPLHDGQVIDRVIAAFMRGAFDYVSNIDPPTYPDGVDTEVFTFAALERAWREARLPSEREHVTPYLRAPHSGFRTANVVQANDASHLRWTVDEVADLAFVRAVYQAMRIPHFGMNDVLTLLRDKPHLHQINGQIARNQGYLRSLEADREAA